MNLTQQIEALRAEAFARLEAVMDTAGLQELKVGVLGKKGTLTAVLKSLATLDIEEKKRVGAFANAFKTELEDRLRLRLGQIEDAGYRDLANAQRYDALRAAPEIVDGHIHPLTRIQWEIEDAFASMGFTVLDGPEVETDHYNFAALNFTDDHPARDMQDTFWTTAGRLLRTHTSPIQVRGMEQLRPPFRVIAPGRVYRYEEVDASHEHTFYQVEGMMVDRKIDVGNLLFMMRTLLSEVLHTQPKVRLRPGYFPFVEPGFELDMRCLVCDGKGCPVCKRSGWVEVLPCGLVHPNVLRSGGIDPEEWQGFAFGLGLNRLVMMRYGIEDIRHFLSGNLRFNRQF